MIAPSSIPRALPPPFVVARALASVAGRWVALAVDIAVQPVRGFVVASAAPPGRGWGRFSGSGRQSLDDLLSGSAAFKGLQSKLTELEAGLTNLAQNVQGFTEDIEEDEGPGGGGSSDSVSDDDIDDEAVAAAAEKAAALKREREAAEDEKRREARKVAEEEKRAAAAARAAEQAAADKAAAEAAASKLAEEQRLAAEV